MKITAFAFLLQFFTWAFTEKCECQRIETRTFDSDSTAAAKVVTDFYAWYCQAVDSSYRRAVHSLEPDEQWSFDPGIVKDTNGMSTLEFSFVEHLRAHHFHEDFIQKIVASYLPCLENLKSIPYDTLETFHLDEYEEIKCDYANGYQWFGGIMEPVHGSDVTGISRKSETELIVTVGLYFKNKPGQKDYFRDGKVSMLRDSAGWKIAGIEF